jgi:hypothetical protein
VKQQADKEMTSIRRILDILGGLSHTQRARVMTFVNGRVADGSFAEVAPRPLSDVKLEAADLAKPSRAAQLPFPDTEATKVALAGLGKAGDALGHALIGVGGNGKDGQ